MNKRIIRKIEHIHSNLHCLHSKEGADYVLETIWNEKSPGPVVECGCFVGGLTAKLSIVCAAKKRKLYIFDSFVGLPYSETTITEDNQIHTFQVGDFASSLVETKANVAMHGNIGVCTFVKGLFNETLPNYHDLNPASVIIDVDLVQSARACIKYLYPQLKGRFFHTHEAQLVEYVDGITNTLWWKKQLGIASPKLNRQKEDRHYGYFEKV